MLVKGHEGLRNGYCMKQNNLCIKSDSLFNFEYAIPFF